MVYFSGMGSILKGWVDDCFPDMFDVEDLIVTQWN